VAKAFYELHTPATVYNTWSPSELVVQTTVHKVTPTDYDNSKANIPIGFPLSNCRHYIVDRKLNPLPVGLVGEIAVGGAQVGQGYINRPKENAKAFLEDPFASPLDVKHGWHRLFRTGDKGRFLQNGELEFHGRIKGDKQIKLRGFRIDLGEVEQRLFIDAADGQGQGLVDVNVTARPLLAVPSSQGVESLTDDRQLVAFLVPKKPLTTKQDAQEFVNTIHTEIGKKLNSYMLPNGFELLPSLPVTIGGKVDRQNLLTRKLELIFPSSAGAASGIQSGQEQTVDGVLNEVVGIFRNVLSLGKERSIGASESFFELGGQSILVMRLQLKIKKTTKVTLPLPVLFKNATPEAIAALIREKRSTSSAKATGNLTAEVEKKLVDWDAETTLPTTRQYNVPDGAQKRERSDQTSILVTGAETFIGLHMVSTLLHARSDTVVHLLGCEQRLSVEQLRAGLLQYHLLDPFWDLQYLESRLHPISGSLRERHFGLSISAFERLGNEIHAVYHMGGEISLLKSYTDLKAINIDATLDIIELASLGKSLTEIHYLSTWSVLHLQSWSSTIFKTASRTIKTEEITAQSFTPAPTTERGYFKARWAAEILVTRAAQRGFPVTIYRPSAVTASTITKVPEPAGDIIRWMVGRMIASECIPDIADGTKAGFAIDFVPVDYLTSTILVLSSHPPVPDFMPTRPAVYHIGNPAPLSLQTLPAIGFLNAKNLGAVPVEEFLRRVDQVLGPGKSVDDELRLSALRDYFTAGHTMFALDRANTAKALAVAGEFISCPPLDRQFLKTMF
jgi:thioester reductase-like protein